MSATYALNWRRDWINDRESGNGSHRLHLARRTAAHREDGTMDIERRSATTEQEAHLAWVAGAKRGRWWAEEYAAPDELARISTETLRRFPGHDTWHALTTRYETLPEFIGACGLADELDDEAGFVPAGEVMHEYALGFVRGARDL